jgi:hypothetical protein
MKHSFLGFDYILHYQLKMNDATLTLSMSVLIYPFIAINSNM